MIEVLSDPETWVAVAFLIFLAILVRLGVPKLLFKTLDDRSARIKAELDEALKLRQEAEGVLADYRRKQSEAERVAEFDHRQRPRRGRATRRRSQSQGGGLRRPAHQDGGNQNRPGRGAGGCRRARRRHRCGCRRGRENAHGKNARPGGRISSRSRHSRSQIETWLKAAASYRIWPHDANRDGCNCAAIVNRRNARQD